MTSAFSRVSPPGANVLSGFGWRTLRSTWSSRWRPLPVRETALGASVALGDAASAGVTLGEAIMKETELIDAAR